MDIIKRNTDYALRLLYELVKLYGKNRPVPARQLSSELFIPYPITCKLLQKLQNKKIVASIMGPKGGYILARPPSKLSFHEVIEVIQGPIQMNRCFLDRFQCPLKERCPLRKKLAKIQSEILSALKDTTLEEFQDKEQEE